ncbi:helix-turn-helix domain-containing protein [Nonomuraea basaltis]|uniref:helix-turn-helix domain-containing protein n=1 Tax=Nonomuraea basaltis TaxID=2495887 RepID=UPI001F0F03B0|nr:helix-turn-helix domain-containing protein [Nonomuraea basaltis]
MSVVKRASKRAQKAQETCRRILEAASELFGRDGYGATNLQDVADKAGVAVQTICFVFGNKRALLKELLYGLLSPELYLLFVHERGWPREHWERWAGETLCAPSSVQVRAATGGLGLSSTSAVQAHHQARLDHPRRTPLTGCSLLSGILGPHMTTAPSQRLSR